MCAAQDLAANGWCQRYGYDRWGNRSIAARVNNGLADTEPSSFDPLTNRITDSGWDYEARGGVKKDPFGRSYGYDGESRMVSTCRDGLTPCPPTWVAGREIYVYDADGRRVRREDGGGQQTVYVYDAAGQLAAEYATAGGDGLGLRYLTLDHLGSTRLVTGSSGAVLERRDYQPFGQDILVTAGNPRQGVTGYGQDIVTQQFTGKERDLLLDGTPTGLDYFGARYFSGAQGRFTTPDAPFVDQYPFNPQTWKHLQLWPEQPVDHY